MKLTTVLKNAGVTPSKRRTLIREFCRGLSVASLAMMYELTMVVVEEVLRRDMLRREKAAKR